MLIQNSTERPSVDELIKLPQISLRIREKKLQENLTRLKKREEELIIKEQKLSEREAEIIKRE